MSHPFANDSYDLPHCVLRPFDETLAAQAAARLAAIPPWATLSYAPATLERFLTGGNTLQRRYAVWADGQPAGAVGVHYPWLRGAYVELIGIFSEAQGRGLGGELIEWMADETRPHAGNLWLLVSTFNEGARRFYRRHGFTELAPIPDLVTPGREELLMRRIL